MKMNLNVGDILLKRVLCCCSVWWESRETKGCQVSGVDCSDPMAVQERLESGHLVNGDDDYGVVWYPWWWWWWWWWWRWWLEYLVLIGASDGERRAWLGSRVGGRTLAGDPVAKFHQQQPYNAKSVQKGCPVPKSPPLIKVSEQQQKTQFKSMLFYNDIFIHHRKNWNNLQVWPGIATT